MAYRSILDIVDARLGTAASSADVMRLNEGEVLGLAEALVAFYDSWRPPTPRRDEIRVFLPTQTYYYRHWEPKWPPPTPPIQQLLYVDTLAVEDPASWGTATLCGHASVSSGSTHWTGVRVSIAATVDAYRPLEHLLRSESLVLTPATYIHENRRNLTKHLYTDGGFDMPAYKERWDEFAALAEIEIDTIARRLGQSTPRPRATDISWEQGSFDRIETHGRNDSGMEVFHWGDSWAVTEALTEGLAGALSASAELLPASMYLEAAYRAFALTVADASQVQVVPSPATVGRALVSGLLPLLSNLPPQALVEIRENDEDFAAWRADLRNTVRLIRASPEAPGFAAEAESVIQDTLVQRMNELQRSSTVTSRLHRGTRDAAITFAVGTLAGVAAGDVTAGLAGGGTTASATLLLQALFPGRPTGSKAVLLRLLPYVRQR